MDMQPKSPIPHQLGWGFFCWALLGNEAAPSCNNPQQMLRGPVKGRVVHLGADPCGYMLETSMGDTGLEPVTSRV